MFLFVNSVHVMQKMQRYLIAQRKRTYMYLPIVATSNLFDLLQNKSGILCVEQAFLAACVISYTFNPPKHKDVHQRQIYKAASH